MQQSQRIDTHHHYVPPFYLTEVGADAVARTLVSGRAPVWTPQHSIDVMDRHGIATAVVSIAAPGFRCDEGKKADLCRRCNDYAAEMCNAFPGRFGSFAGLPLPDIDVSLREINRSLGELNAEGICLMTSYDGRYLGDPLFVPIFEELDRRGAVVYVHPTEGPCTCGLALPPASLEYPFDTTRTIASLLFSGALNRFRNIKFIFSHAGGTIPFIAERLARLERRPDYVNHVPEGVLAELRRLHYDTALSANRLAMDCLLALVTAKQVLFGGDYPYAPEEALTGTVKGLSVLDLPDDELAAIERANAIRLMPSLQPRL